MECPKCEHKAVVAYKRPYRLTQGDPLFEIRVYVCENLDCMYSFSYRNQYLGPNERFDAAKFLRAYEKQKNKNQQSLFEEE